jgi:NADPH-dependent curcumin reductase CurA
MSAILTKRLTLRGYIVSDFASQTSDFLHDVGAWLRDGQLKYREDVDVGLEKAPSAFIELLKGQNLGKLVVRVAESMPDWTCPLTISPDARELLLGRSVILCASLS